MINWFMYSNCQHIALTFFKIWLVHNSPKEKDHLNINIVTAQLLYNACTLLNTMEISVTNNNKLKIHPSEMANLKKSCMETEKRWFELTLNRLHVWNHLMLQILTWLCCIQLWLWMPNQSKMLLPKDILIPSSRWQIFVQLSVILFEK